MLVFSCSSRKNRDYSFTGYPDSQLTARAFRLLDRIDLSHFSVSQKESEEHFKRIVVNPSRGSHHGGSIVEQRQ